MISTFYLGPHVCACISKEESATALQQGTGNVNIVVLEPSEKGLPEQVHTHGEPLPPTTLPRAHRLLGAAADYLKTIECHLGWTDFELGQFTNKTNVFDLQI